MIIVTRNPGPSSLIMSDSLLANEASPALCQIQRNDDLVNEPNAGERDDYSAQAIDQQIAAQQGTSANRLVLHPAQGQWNQGDDDQRVEYDGSQYCALG